MPTPALVALEVITPALTVLLTLVKRIESPALVRHSWAFPRLCLNWTRQRCRLQEVLVPSRCKTPALGLCFSKEFNPFHISDPKRRSAHLLKEQPIPLGSPQAVLVAGGMWHWLTDCLNDWLGHQLTNPQLKWTPRSSGNYFFWAGPSLWNMRCL